MTTKKILITFLLMICVSCSFNENLQNPISIEYVDDKVEVDINFTKVNKRKNIYFGTLTLNNLDDKDIFFIYRADFIKIIYNNKTYDILLHGDDNIIYSKAFKLKKDEQGDLQIKVENLPKDLKLDEARLFINHNIIYNQLLLK